LRNPEMWAPEIEKSGNVGSRNREIRKNLEMWAPEIEKSGKIWKCGLWKSRNPGKSGKTGSAGPPKRGNPENRASWGALFGPDLAQPAPKWGTFWFRLPEGRSGPARPRGQPARPPKRSNMPSPWGGVYIRIGGSFWACNIWGNI